jgi:hypothetical protein
VVFPRLTDAALNWVMNQLQLIRIVTKTVVNTQEISAVWGEGEDEVYKRCAASNCRRLLGVTQRQSMQFHVDHYVYKDVREMSQYNRNPALTSNHHECLRP